MNRVQRAGAISIVSLVLAVSASLAVAGEPPRVVEASIADLQSLMESGEMTAESITAAYLERIELLNGKLHAVTLDPNLEEYVDNAIERTDRGSFLAISPEVSGRILTELTEKLKVLLAEGHPPVVLCAPQIRYQLRRLLAGHMSDVVVLSLSEIQPEVEVEVVGNVAVSV